MQHDRHDHERGCVRLHDAAEEQVEVEDDAEQQPGEEPADRVALHRGLARITRPTLRIAKNVSTSDAISTGLRVFEPEICTVTAPVHTTVPRSDGCRTARTSDRSARRGSRRRRRPGSCSGSTSSLQRPLPISISPERLRELQVDLAVDVAACHCPESSPSSATAPLRGISTESWVALYCVCPIVAGRGARAVDVGVGGGRGQRPAPAR